jgi:hypothetical protein
MSAVGIPINELYAMLVVAGTFFQPSRSASVESRDRIGIFTLPHKSMLEFVMVTGARSDDE